MVGKCATMKTKNAGKPTQVPSGKSNDPTPEVAGQMLDSRPGRYLMTTGTIVIIVGIVYSAFNWYIRHANPQMEWNQMLGPFQVIAGFVLVFVGLFLYVNFRDDGSIGRSMPHVFRVSPIMPITSPIPVKLSGKAREACHASESHPDRSVNGVDAALPPYDAVYCVDNAAFVAEGKNSPQKTGDENRSNDETHSTCSHPPTYEDVNPFSGKCSPV